MQTSKSRNGSSDGPQKSSPATPKATRMTKGNGSDSESTSTHTPTRPSANRSPRVAERRSPRSPAAEKRPSKLKELESQLTQLQDDLKKTKDQLSSSEASKKKAQQEAEEAKKQILAISAKLEESQQQLGEFVAAEESRLQELQKISQDRDRAWESELEAIQKQHSMDCTALNSARSELQKLKVQLDVVAKSEAAHAEESELARSELETLKKDMAETLALVENLSDQLRDSKKVEGEAQSMLSETQQQLEAAKSESDALHNDGLKLKESFNSAVSELEESRARVASLEEMVRKLLEDLLAVANGSEIKGEGKCQETMGRNSTCLESKVEQLKSALEAAEVKHQEQQIQSTVLLHSAQELVESTKTESEGREATMELELKAAKAEIFDLRTSLAEKENVLQSILVENKELKGERAQAEETESESGTKLKKLTAEVSKLKGNLMDKETELQNILEENEQLKSEMKSKDTESHKNYEAAIAELELAKAAKRDALIRLSNVTEEADKSSRKATKAAEQLDAAQAMNTEMEAELRRLSVQSDQWRKAAEAAAAVLTTSDNGKLMDRTASMDTDYHSIGGKLMSSPFSEDLSDESPKKKNNNNVLKKIGGLWKKAPK